MKGLKSAMQSLSLGGAFCVNPSYKNDDQTGADQAPKLLRCSTCHLVQYCSKDCQKQHWPIHQHDCSKSLLGKKDWQPIWISERRKPSFVTPTGGQVPFGKMKYLLGNIPAFDVLKLRDNEGLDLEKRLDLCFAASGNPRNIILTVNGLPEAYTERCTCIVNDWDLDIVIRNIVILLSAFVLEPEVAPTAMLHIWYSATLPSFLSALIRNDLQPLIKDVCNKIRESAENSLQAKTFYFNTSQVRIILQKSQWDKFHSMLTTELSLETAEQARKDVMLAPSRVDYLHRKIASLKGFQRVVFTKQRESGILASFATSIEAFTEPNPTMHGPEGEWLLFDSANPLDGGTSPMSSRQATDTTSQHLTFTVRWRNTSCLH